MPTCGRHCGASPTLREWRAASRQRRAEEEPEGGQRRDGEAEGQAPGRVPQLHGVPAGLEPHRLESDVGAQYLRRPAVDPRPPARVVGLGEDQSPGAVALDLDRPTGG